MINPSKVTNYSYSDYGLQEFALFTVCVTGKTAVMIAKQLEVFLSYSQRVLPFDKVAEYIERDNLLSTLKAAKLGQYNRLCKTLLQLIKLNLRTCTLDDLEAIHGIGPKTARYFILHTRPDQQIVPLDTHILKYLSSIGFKTPKHTPTSKSTYKTLESAFLDEARKHNFTAADFDLKIWNQYSTKDKNGVHT